MIVAFAKLYERDGIQVLVKMDTNEQSKPEVRFFTEPEGLGVCSLAVEYKESTDEMWDKCEDFFEKVTEEQAFSMVSSIANIF